MERVPSIVSIDCTQTCVLQEARGAAERWSLGFNLRRDGEIFARAAAIVAISEWVAADLRRLYPSCRAPIHVMPNPVTLELFDPAWVDARLAREGRIQCLFMGGDFPRKGGYDLLEAWERGGFARDADLTLVTSWNIGRALPAGVRQLRQISSHTPEWCEAWRGADLFVMPTRNEAFGLVFQEAAAAGLPAIGTTGNAVPEIVCEEQTGLLVAPGDIPALVAAMDRLIGSPELRHAFGRRGRAYIEESADPGRYLARLVDLLSAAARHRRVASASG
jgi:glycosyltransferase involved in cell wall biosynthesis